MALDRCFSVLAIDDQPESLAALRQLLEQYPDAPSLSCVFVNDADTFARAIAEQAPMGFDIVFADIDLGPDNPSGVELVKRHEKQLARAQVVYQTGFLKLVPEIFGTPHCFVMDKPVTPERLNEGLHRAFSALGSDSANTPCLGVTVNGCVSKIPASDILWIGSDQHKVLLHTFEGVIEAPGPLNSYEERLPSCFFRIHRKYLVNFEHVDSIDNGASLTDGTVLPISRHTKTATRDAFLSYIEGTLE